MEEYQDASVIQPCCDTINIISAMMRNAGQPVTHIQDVTEVGDGNGAAYALCRSSNENQAIFWSQNHSPMPFTKLRWRHN